jgi:hypothetical protein
VTRISVTTVSPLDDNSWRYEVEVIESDGSGSKTNHEVTMDKDYYMNLTEKGQIIPRVWEGNSEVTRSQIKY